MKVSINELKSMIAKIIKEEKSKTFTKSKTAKKLSLNELRGLVKNIIKEEMGTGNFIGDLVVNNPNIKYYKTAMGDKSYNKTSGARKLPKNGEWGRVDFNTAIENVIFNKKSTQVESIKNPDSVVVGQFNENGLIDGYLYERMADQSATVKSGGAMKEPFADSQGVETDLSNYKMVKRLNYAQFT
jgi:hypothetical protein